MGKSKGSKSTGCPGESRPVNTGASKLLPHRGPGALKSVSAAACDASANPEDHAKMRAVSIGALLNFTEEYDLWNVPTCQVVQSIIVPKTGTDATGRPVACRYADLLPPEDLGHVDVFVSHTWKNSFGLLVATARKFASEWKGRRSKEAIFFWVDIFAINQHQVDGSHKDLSQLEEVVEVADSTLMVLDTGAAPLSRIWCVFEILVTIRGPFGKLKVRLGDNHGTREFHPINDPEILRHIAETFDVASAEASIEQDRESIFKRILALPGGFAGVNRIVRRLARKGWS